jgi:hypothetical protein
VEKILGQETQGPPTDDDEDMLAVDVDDTPGDKALNLISQRYSDSDSDSDGDSESTLSSDYDSDSDSDSDSGVQRIRT